MRLVWGFMVSQAIHVAAKMSSFDLLGDGPRTAVELAETTRCHALALRRLLRLLTTVELLVEDEQGCFSVTPLGELLRADHPQSARAYAVM